MAEDGVDLEDSNQDVETKYIEEETQKEEKEKLYEASETPFCQIKISLI